MATLLNTSITGSLVLSNGSQAATLTTNSNSRVNFSGGIIANGTSYLYGTTYLRETVSTSTNTYNLGSTTVHWAHAYIYGGASGKGLVISKNSSNITDAVTIGHPTVSAYQGSAPTSTTTYKFLAVDPTVITSGSRKAVWVDLPANAFNGGSGGGSTDLTAITTNVLPNSATNSLSVGSSSYPWNEIYGVTVYATSDQRLKTDITKTSYNFSDILKQLNIKNFKFKHDEAHLTQVGLIAQETAKVLPEELKESLVKNCKNKNETMSINEGKIHYLTMGAVQELIHENEDLKARVSFLENEIAEIKKLLMKEE